MIDSYYKLPVGKYNELELLAHDTTLDDMERNTAMLAVLSDISEKELLELPIAEYSALSEKASFLMKPAKAEKNVAKKYKLGDWELKPCDDYSKMTAAQYIDFQTYGAMKEDSQQLCRLLSCMLVPVGHKYNNGYDIKQLQDAIRDNMPITDAIAYSNFVSAKWCSSMIASLRCLALTMKRKQRMKIWELVEALSTSSGGGLVLWIW